MTRVLHPIFRFDPQAICNTVDVVEVANDLGCNCDLFVCDAGIAEAIEMQALDLRRLESKQNGKVAEPSFSF